MFKNVARQLRPRFARSVSQALADPTAWNQAPAVVTKLPNGVRVASKSTFGETASVGVFIDAGVRSESKDMPGATHLIEQLALTGTSKRAKGALAAEVEAMGATLSVGTGREQTAYTMTALRGDLKKSVDILSDVVLSPGVANYEKEKGAILRRLDEMDLPNRAVIDDRLHTCAFRDCSLGFSKVGPFDGIEAITTDQLAKYVEASYTADKMVVAAVGPMQHEELVSMAAAAFGGVKAGAPAMGVDKPYFCGAELIYRNDEMGPIAYVSVGWEGVPYKSPDAVTFMLMQKIIGSYKKTEGLVPGTISGNRVVNAVANKMGVGCAEEYEAFNLNYKDTGMFGFYAVCDEVAVEHCIGELMFGANLLSFAVTDEEVERAKRELKVSLFSGNGSTSAACSELGSQVLAYGRGLPASEMMLRIDAIDAEEVKRVAYKYLNDAEVAVTGLGPLHGMPQYMDLRRSTYMHRY